MHLQRLRLDRRDGVPSTAHLGVAYHAASRTPQSSYKLIAERNCPQLCSKPVFVVESGRGVSSI